jgi:hypothetical protein
MPKLSSAQGIRCAKGEGMPFDPVSLAFGQHKNPAHREWPPAVSLLGDTGNESDLLIVFAIGRLDARHLRLDLEHRRSTSTRHESEQIERSSLPVNGSR